jgi:hypothetical protein
MISMPDPAAKQNETIANLVFDAKLPAAANLKELGYGG